MKWAAVIQMKDAHQLASIRLLVGVEVTCQEPLLWLRGGELDGPVSLALRKISGLDRYDLTEDGQCIQPGHLIPARPLPQGSWVALSKFLAPEVPVASLAGDASSPVSLQVVPSNLPRQPGALLASLADWLEYACIAPEVRLRALTFAVSSRREALILGCPLPPVRGTAMVVESGLIVPCGYRWQPELDAEAVWKAFPVETGDMVLLRPDVPFEVIAKDQFVAATRSAVRLTAKEVPHR